MADTYDARLRDTAITLPRVVSDCQSAWAQYTIRVQDRAKVQSVLREAGIPTTVHYPLPLNRQPAVADTAVSLPEGDLAADEVLSLPMHPYLEEDDVKKVSGVLAEAVER